MILLILMLSSYDIYLVSELDDRLAKEMMTVPVSSIKEGLKRAFQTLGENAEVALIPEGPLVLPLIRRK